MNVRKIVSACAIVLALFLTPLSAKAEAKTFALVNLPEQKDLRVEFDFDTEIQPVTLISPDGTEYSGNSANLFILKTDDMQTTYILKSADAGVWKAKLEDGTNSHVNYQVLPEPIYSIHGFTVGVGKRSDILTCSFNVMGTASGMYNYEIYLTNRSTGKSEKIKTDTGEVGTPVEDSVSFKDTNAGIYTLSLYVSDQKGTLIDFVNSAEIRYEASNDLVFGEEEESIYQMSKYVSALAGVVAVLLFIITFWPELTGKNRKNKKTKRA